MVQSNHSSGQKGDGTKKSDARWDGGGMSTRRTHPIPPPSLLSSSFFFPPFHFYQRNSLLSPLSFLSVPHNEVVPRGGQFLQHLSLSLSPSGFLSLLFAAVSPSRPSFLDPLRLFLPPSLLSFFPSFPLTSLSVYPQLTEGGMRVSERRKKLLLQPLLLYTFFGTDEGSEGREHYSLSYWISG